MLDQFKARLHEPSSYAGLAGILVTSAATAPEPLASLCYVLAGIAGLAAFFLPERK